MKRFKLTIFIAVICLLCFLAFFIKKEAQGNLLKTLLPESVVNAGDIIPLADKTSSLIKVVFESDSNEKTKEIKDNFIKNIDKDYFEINKYDFSSLVNQYTEHPENFLSDRTRELIKNEKFDEVYENSIEALYNPSEIQLTTMDKDPFLLFNDFIFLNQKIKLGQNYIDGKYYDYLSLKIKNNEGLSPDYANKKISELVKSANNIDRDNSKIYLAGSPVHSYYTSTKAKFMINIICILSTLLIILLTYYYFKNIKPIFLIALSIITGMLTGFVATNLWFDSFQIITMVFSTTLIGIGIDYSYHSFFCTDAYKNLTKNLTYSLLTTIIPFILLYLTGIELLKQVAVFTSFGLSSIYLTVILIYPCFDTPKPQKTITLNYTFLKWIFIVLSILGVIGCQRITANDSPTALYTPSKKLLKAEKLYNEVSGEEFNNAKIITVAGNNFDDIIKKEEEITKDFNNDDYIAISKFLPSSEKQKENFELTKKLYEKELKNYSEILTDAQMKALMKTEFSPVKFNQNDYPFLNEFLLSDNKSLIFVFSENYIPIYTDDAKIIDLKSDIEDYMKEYRQKLLWLFPIVLAVLSVITGSIFGLKKSLKILAPPFIGILFATGLSGLIFGELNLFSIITLFLLLGFTMDYSIFRADEKKNCEDAILTSAITTSCSFLLLIFAGFKLLSTMAVVLFFGIITSYITGYLIFKKE